MPDLTPESIRSREFGVARRGYDRGDVDAFKSEVAEQVVELRERLDTLRTSMEQVGLSDAPDVKQELDAVAAEVGRVLHEARQAAEQMRGRAAGDAARWRAEADTEVRTARDDADRDAQHARKDAWDTSTDMLDQAQERADELLAGAEQDALFIRAEAEREALRMTGDARRDSEEMNRESKAESDRIAMAARAEAEGILTQARQSADSAQERARALEKRRGELMEELESARESIGQLENEIDTRRGALQAAASSTEPGMRIIESDERQDNPWTDVDLGVRIVPVSRVPIETPVDADALAAEVEQLRAASVAPVAEEPVAEDAVTEEPATEEVVTDTAVAGEAAEPPAEAGEPQTDDAVEGPAKDEDTAEIDDLFASLRAVPEEPEPDPSPVAAGAERPPPPEPVEPEPRAEPIRAEPVTAADPFDARDRHLLPISNRTLRTIKREIVELQNRVLEELRAAGASWQVDGAMFAAALSDEISRLVQESFVAGHAGAAELVGGSVTPQPSVGPPTQWPAEIVDDLSTAVAAAYSRTTSGGGGARQVSAAVSKVFRAWRTDEAERRLRQASRSAYHFGLLDGLPQLGVDEVMAIALGRPCGECPAEAGVTWRPGEEPGDGLVIPPASLSCDATLVPATAPSF